MSYKNTIDTMFPSEEKKADTSEDGQETAESETTEDAAPPADDTSTGDSELATTDTGSAETSFSTKAPEGYVPVAVMEDERRKWQELRDKLLEMKGKISVLEKPEQQAEEEVEEEEDFWSHDDPGAFVKKTAKAAVDTYAQAQMNERTARSQTRARKAHADYDAVEQKYMKLAEAQPAVAAALWNDSDFRDDPAEGIYSFMQNMVPVTSTARAQMKAELLAEIKVEMAGTSPAAPEIPESNAGARGTSNGVGNSHLPDGEALFEDAFNPGY